MVLQVQQLVWNPLRGQLQAPAPSFYRLLDDASMLLTDSLEGLEMFARVLDRLDE